MSEEKKESIWKGKVQELIREETADLRKMMETSGSPSKPPENVNPDHPSHDLKGLLECPDCYPKVKEAVLDKEILSRKDKEYECVDCGTRVDEEEESCPTCGGKEARHRD